MSGMLKSRAEIILYASLIQCPGVLYVRQYSNKIRYQEKNLYFANADLVCPLYYYLPSVQIK
jgi:hypothetical protein